MPGYSILHDSRAAPLLLLLPCRCCCLQRRRPSWLRYAALWGWTLAPAWRLLPTAWSSFWRTSERLSGGGRVPAPLLVAPSPCMLSPLGTFTAIALVLAGGSLWPRCCRRASRMPRRRCCSPARRQWWSRCRRGGSCSRRRRWLWSAWLPGGAGRRWKSSCQRQRSRGRQRAGGHENEREDVWYGNAAASASLPFCTIDKDG